MDHKYKQHRRETQTKKQYDQIQHVCLFYITLHFAAIYLVNTNKTRLVMIIYMNPQIRNKYASFRKDLRSKQLNDYFNSVRKQLPFSIHQQDPLSPQNHQFGRAINEQLDHLIDASQFYQIYQLLANNITDKVRLLSQPNCMRLFDLLAHNLSTKECPLLLKPLIAAHFHLIFTEEPNVAQDRRWAIQQIYNQVYQSIHELMAQTSQQRKQQLKGIVELLLDCIFTLFALSKNRGEDSYVHRQIFNIKDYSKLWIGLTELHSTPYFLVILTIMNIFSQFSLQHPFQQFIQENIWILERLIDQIVPGMRKTLALPSLSLVNQLLKSNGGNRQIAAQILPLYMEKIKVVYSDTEQGQNHYFRQQNFYEMMSNLQILFQTLADEPLNVHVGEIMVQARLWQFFYLLLRVQTRLIRQTIYNLIACTVQNMVISKANLEDYVGEELFYFLVEGLQAREPSVLLTNLKSVQLLLNAARNSLKLFNYFCEYNMGQCLSDLEDSTNQLVSQTAANANSELQHIRQRYTPNDTI